MIELKMMEKHFEKVASYEKNYTIRFKYVHKKINKLKAGDKICLREVTNKFRRIKMSGMILEVVKIEQLNKEYFEKNKQDWDDIQEAYSLRGPEYKLHENYFKIYFKPE